MFTYILTHKMDDRFLLSEMLLLPTENYIGEQMAIVDVDAIHHVREFILTEIATQLQPLFMQVYGDNQSKLATYAFNIEEVASAN